MYRVKVLAILWLVGLLLAGCGGQAGSAIGGTTTPVAASVVNGPVPTTSYDQVKQAIDDLYSQHPGVNSFIVQAVSYTPETRDKVLRICREGSVASSPQELESQQVSACAPLIFFFYHYGQQNAVPAAVDLARTLYAYAVTGKSADSRKGLNDLLQSWGIQ